MKVDVSQGKVEKEKLKVETSALHDYISMPRADEVNLIDKLKTKVCSWIFGLSLHTKFQDNVQGLKTCWGPKSL